MNVHVLTEYEVHQIAYLTQNGWTCNEHGEWRKAGKTRTINSRYYEGRTEETDTWCLDDAYWEEQP